jgi:hypothetical protein
MGSSFIGSVTVQLRMIGECCNMHSVLSTVRVREIFQEAHPENIYTNNQAACLLSHLKAININQTCDDGRDDMRFC